MLDGITCRLAGITVCRYWGVNIKLALQIIEMAPASYCVTYKTGADTGHQGEGKVIRRENNSAHRGISVPDHWRD